MYLKKVQIKGYRNLDGLSLEFQPGLNVVVGRNNIGKTNLFMAIRHALGPTASRGEPLWLSNDDRYTTAEEVANKIQISLTFSSLNEDQLAQFFEAVDFNVDSPNDSEAKIYLEAIWQKEKNRFNVKRFGGAIAGERTQIANEILEALPITFLPALRDSEAALTPGYRNRLALLLQDLAARSQEEGHEEKFVQIFEEANTSLLEQDLIKTVTGQLSKSTQKMAGPDYVPSAIRAAEPNFKRILRSLKISLDNPVSELSCNGLGYNNLLYIATVLTHLGESPSDECPILLVEEPEAHLHPQRTMLLGEYLAGRLTGSEPPQTIVSTHSPTFAANVKPSRILVMYQSGGNRIFCSSIKKAGLDRKEERQLQRMLDITRATLYFCRGLILVEGVSEALLTPELAKLLGYRLEQSHISILPICGVAFQTLKKILQPGVLGIPVSILTDSDPEIVKGGNWEHEMPKPNDRSPRTQKLIEAFKDNKNVKVFTSEVTLEYDLAKAGSENAKIMTQAWVDSFKGTPQTLNDELLGEAGADVEEKALTVWRGICRADHSGSKADFAHVLSERLHLEGSTFGVPKYITDAVEHVHNGTD